MGHYVYKYVDCSGDILYIGLNYNFVIKMYFDNYNSFEIRMADECLKSIKEKKNDD